SGRGLRTARRDRSSGVRASGRATCTARSAARAPRDRPLGGTGGGAPCRSSGSLGAFDALDALLELDPVAAFPLDRRETVDDRLQHASQTDAVVGTFELGPQSVAGERAESGLDGVLPDLQLDGQLTLLSAPLEQRLQGRAEVVHDLVAEVEPGCDPGEHKLGDVLAPLIARNREQDPVRRQSRPAPTTTPSSQRTAV